MHAAHCLRSRTVTLAVLALTVGGTALLTAALVRAVAPPATGPSLIVRCLSDVVDNQDGFDTRSAEPHRQVTFEYELVNRGGTAIQIGEPQLFCLCALEESPEGELAAGAARRMRFRFDAPAAGVRREAVRIPTSTGVVSLNAAIQTAVTPPALVLIPDAVTMSIVRGTPAERMFLLSAVERDGTEPAYRPEFTGADPGFALVVDDGEVAPAHEPGCIVRTYRCTVYYDGEPSTEAGELVFEAAFSGTAATRESIPVRITVQDPIAVAPQAIRFASGAEPRVTLTFLSRDVEGGALEVEWVADPSVPLSVTRIEDDNPAVERFVVEAASEAASAVELRFRTNQRLQPEISVVCP